MHISEISAAQGRLAARTARDASLVDRYAVPHLWVSEELHFVTADWQSPHADEGRWVSDRPPAPVPAWRPV
jgi:hypothetical protein